MPLLVGGDSLTRNNGFAGSFYVPLQPPNRAILLNDFPFHKIIPCNDWKKAALYNAIPSSYPVWQYTLPITRLQQLSLGTKRPGIVEKSLQQPYPTVIPSLNTFSNPNSAANIFKNQSIYNNTKQNLILQSSGLTSNNPNLLRKTTQKLSSQLPRKSVIESTKLSTQKSDVSNGKPTEINKGYRAIKKAPQKEVQVIQNPDKNKHIPSPQESSILSIRKRSSSWPGDMQLKKKFLKKSEDAEVIQSYKNLEMDVANILVSDIPIPVVGLSGSKETDKPAEVVPELENESKRQSSESSVDSDNSSQSDRENNSNKGNATKVLFTCQQCAITCNSTEELIAHNSKHASKNFVFTCNVCSQVFRSTNGLQKHVEFHADDDHRHSCSFCFQPFNSNDGLEQHIVNVHMSKRPHKCTYCPKAFRDPGSLQKHVRVHTGEKPYHCTSCEKSFAEYSSLRKHLRVHTGEQPYKCKFCPKAFSISGNLQRHILIHTGERPYKCSDCSKAFNNPSHLRRHVKNLHSKLETDK